ncbi:response regulator [Trichlorobacter ammonificans]|uniref:Response regulatory domain-containing protein n=1 Tax=Trichlorobacter ammonificans TaxID=2916410 RepID=A0ABN8HJZ9_9BACT|nr:response regulator [Trichlorobacter ammonificans]CAH2031235.1 protein of unknown function [Trichlorobacter ammonificans]
MPQNDATAATRIMVVDDEPAVLKMLTTFLESCGYRVTACVSPMEAFEFLSQEHDTIDLVITDIRMPEMDGIRLLTGIRHLSLNLPVLLMTGYADFEQVVEGLRNHAFDILLKPIDLPQLQWSITKALGYLKHQRLERQYQLQLEERVIGLNRLVQEQFEELQRIRTLTGTP